MVSNNNKNIIYINITEITEMNVFVLADHYSISPIEMVKFLNLKLKPF